MTHYILTLKGMYEYDSTIFNNIVLPSDADKDVLVQTILDYCGDNEVRYPSFPLLTNRIQNFFEMWKYKYERLWLTTTQEYEMIENYDRNEEWTNKDDKNLSGSSTYTYTGNTTSSGSNTSEQKTSAFNSTSYSPKDQTTTNLSNSTSDNNTNSGTSSNTEDNTSTHTGRVHGNIGVTTSQQMIQSERELDDFSWYYTVAMDFEDAITIPVY